MQNYDPLRMLLYLKKCVQRQNQFLGEWILEQAKLSSLEQAKLLSLDRKTKMVTSKSNFFR